MKFVRQKEFTSNGAKYRHTNTGHKQYMSKDGVWKNHHNSKIPTFREGMYNLIRNIALFFILVVGTSYILNNPEFLEKDYIFEYIAYGIAAIPVLWVFGWILKGFSWILRVAS